LGRIGEEFGRTKQRMILGEGRVGAAGRMDVSLYEGDLHVLWRAGIEREEAKLSFLGYGLEVFREKRRPKAAICRLSIAVVTASRSDDIFVTAQKEDFKTVGETSFEMLGAVWTFHLSKLN
jgi:hypothetical protein